MYLVVARRLAAVLIAASLLGGAPRALLLASAAVAVAGLGVAALFGDVWMMELVTQLRPWRALWLLAVMGNAGLVVCAVRLWRGGDGDRLVLAALVTAWLADQQPALQIVALAAALGLRAASIRGFAPRMARTTLKTIAMLVACLALYGVAQSAMVTIMLLRAAWDQGGETVWPFAIDTGVAEVPVMVAALALVLVPAPRLRGLTARRPLAIIWTSSAVLAGASILAALAWDETPAEHDAARYPEATAALHRAIGPSAGEVMWIDEDDETWFLAGRAAFFATVQGAPIPFSRALALDWAGRAATARALGWAREIDVSPWTAPSRRLDPIVLRPADIETFCRNPRRPAAVVAPGEQLGAAPRGGIATLWRPAKPFHRMWIDGRAIRWTSWSVFTVVRCPSDALGASPQNDAVAGTRDR